MAPKLMGHYEDRAKWKVHSTKRKSTLKKVMISHTYKFKVIKALERKEADMPRSRRW